MTAQPSNVIDLASRRPLPVEAMLNLKEVMDRYGYSDRWWRYVMKEPGFPKHKWGGHWRFRASEIEAWMAQRKPGRVCP